MNSQNRLKIAASLGSLSWVQPVRAENDPVIVNEVIHDLIEEAASEQKKAIWKISPLAANALERAYLTQDSGYLRELIKFAVSHSNNKIIQEKDIYLARYFINLFNVKPNSI